MTNHFPSTDTARIMKAITRAISSAMQDCELTHMDRQPLDLDRARQQHEAYNQALRDLAVDVIELPEQPDLADTVFVEDSALVFDEVAIITHPGAVSRRPETSSIAEAIKPHRPLATIKAPAILDGGDVLTIGKEVYVGLSSRSNRDAVVQCCSRWKQPALREQVTPTRRQPLRPWATT